MICNKKNCVGCFACYNICPKNAIEMAEDDNGFIYPKINYDKCINCNLCKKVCPGLNDLEYNLPKKCYAMQRKNKNKLNESSSGGVASVLAEEILKNGGIVYASIFEKKFLIHHVRISNFVDLKKMKGSKYVHSYIEDTYKNVKNDLIKKKKVLFIGTPCQVAGLKMFLMKEYENLICVDLICHGVPSQLYLKDELEILTDVNKINKLKFRENNDFRITANSYNCSLDIEMDKSRYYRGFMNSLFYRENCYECKYAKKKRISDITIGDFWGLSQNSNLYKNRNDGVSVVLVCTKKGEMLIEKCKDEFKIDERPIDEAIEGNDQLRNPAKRNKKYYKFKKRYSKKGFNKAYDRTWPIICLKNKLKKNKTILKLYFKIKEVLKK